MPEQHRNRSDIARDRLNVVAQIGQLTDSTNRMSEANYLDPAVAEENAQGFGAVETSYCDKSGWWTVTLTQPAPDGGDR